jgi:homoserine kinase
VVELDARHAFANIALTDNVVRFATSRYNNNPLIVQGPGAGPEVTAGGIFADLLRLSGLPRSAAVSGLAGTARPCSGATAFAPASVGNVGIGFDILRLRRRRASATASPWPAAAVPGVRITGCTGVTADSAARAEKNTAGRALLALNIAAKPAFGFDMHIEKGIPLGSGLGGSAASAVGAVVAANALLEEPFDRLATAQVRDAGRGGRQRLAARRQHRALALRRAACSTVGIDNPRVKRIPVPAGHLRRHRPPAHVPLHQAGARHPQARGGDGRLRLADRESRRFHLRLLHRRSGSDPRGPQRRGHRAAAAPAHSRLLGGACRGDQPPARSGCSISGAGPTMFAWALQEHAALVRERMVAEFARNGVEADHWIVTVESDGARIVAQ